MGLDLSGNSSDSDTYRRTRSVHCSALSAVDAVMLATAVCPAETDVPIELPFRVRLVWACVLHGVHIGATWRIRQSDARGGDGARCGYRRHCSDSFQFEHRSHRITSSTAAARPAVPSVNSRPSLVFCCSLHLLEHSTQRHSTCTISFFLSPAAKDIPVSSILP